MLAHISITRNPSRRLSSLSNSVETMGPLNFVFSSHLFLSVCAALMCRTRVRRLTLHHSTLMSHATSPRHFALPHYLSIAGRYLSGCMRLLSQVIFVTPTWIALYWASALLFLTHLLVSSSLAIHCFACSFLSTTAVVSQQC